MFEQEILLPTLRDDLQLNEAPSELEGSPTWTLYDPAANKYYKIGWLEFECLARFKSAQTVQNLLKKVRAETTLKPDLETIEDLLKFLAQHHLVQSTGDEALDYFNELTEKAKKPWWEKLVHSYLFFTIPLFKPQNFLRKTYPFISPIFSKPFMTVVFMLLGYGIFLSVQRVDEITTTFMSYLNLEGIILLVGSTILVKIIHELGHAYTATKYGVPVTTIGVAFIVLYPILYTETTNAWKMKNRNERLTIAAGGLMAELALASVTLILWHHLTPGLLQSLCFMVAVVSMLASLLVNLNPLMKFDGYYLFSDLVGVDNLQDRSFAFGKWRLRKSLWGWQDDPPEILQPEQQHFLTTFGYAVWVYRFFLYLGIALLIYHLFFPPLGLILMVIELGFFLGLPTLKEIKVWVGRYEDIILTPRGIVPLSLIAGGFLLVFVPFKKDIEVPAVMHAQNYTRFYANVPAQIEEVFVSHGQKVSEGDLLFKLTSPNLDQNILLTQQRLKSLEEIKTSSQATADLAKKRSMIDSEIEITRKELEGFQKIKEQMNINAPFSGTIKILDPSVKKGRWVNTSYMLGLLADEETKILSGYIRESDLDLVSQVKNGKFYAEYTPLKSFDVVLDQIGDTGAFELFWPELSSSQGGSIPAEASSDGAIRPLPQYTVYPVRFRLGEGENRDSLPDFVARGAVNITGKRQSIANALFKKTVSSLIIERGF